MIELSPATSSPSHARILVVDDDESIRVAMARYLRRGGYEVEVAIDGVDADSRLGASGAPFDAMICDVRMPGLDGSEVLDRALTRDPFLAVVMLTAVNDAPLAADLLGRGASDYLVKPVELRALQDALLRALDRRALRLEKQRFDQRIQEEVRLRTRELEIEKEALRDLSVNVVETLINAMEAKDLYLRGHSQRVADLAAEVAHELALDELTVERIRLAGRLHDVG
ncbi:MAG: response regulator, partial [Gemmatimonadaceae bacterium]|nr:response regulator [Gemmatimonadaceae bacterium]MCU0626678.1 response regulator [Gemmatimonadaceae bacterium]